MGNTCKQTQIYEKNCTAVIGTREIQTKAMLKVCITTVRVVIIKTNTEECWQECGRKETIYIVGMNIK